ncbi:MAG: LemA family protein [Methanobrevibacter sp.]|nr:LemA family protein [Methanobrevibacter sp.]
MWIYLIIGIVVIVILAIIVGIYNGLVGARNKVKNAWSQIDVQLKRRIDLIPNLIETVKGYAGHEKGVFTDITEARSGLMKATSVKEVEAVNNQITSALKTLFAVAENYPDLKASHNFQDLQNKLSETEDKIAYSRQFYNDSVLMYNNKCQMFPSNIFASLFNFNEADFFEAAETDRATPSVKF